MKIKIILDAGAFPPERAHPEDAGLDLKSPAKSTIPAKGCVTIDTGVHVQLPKGTAGFLKSKSGLNVKHSIVSEGVIDEGYTGSIRVKLYNHGEDDYRINKGDKITQLVILPVLRPVYEITDRLEETERGADGFGSTGR